MIAGLGITLLLLDDLWPELREYSDFSGVDGVPVFDDSSLALLSSDAFNEASALDSDFGSSDSGGFGGFGDGGGDGGGGGD